MNNFKKILVAVDLGSSADQVMERAAQVAADSGADVNVIYVGARAVPIYGGFMGEGAYIADNGIYDEVEVCKGLEQQLEKKVRQFGLPVEKVIVDIGRAVDVILDVAESEAADLIVLGSHGRHGVGLLLGSTANGVLHRANCDVLAVRIKSD